MLGLLGTAELQAPFGRIERQFRARGEALSLEERSFVPQLIQWHASLQALKEGADLRQLAPEHCAGRDFIGGEPEVQIG